MSPEDFSDSAPREWGRDRRSAISEVALAPESLVGSYFHRTEGDRIIEAGLVVGEVQPGCYLVAVDAAPGQVPYQRVSNLSAMMGELDDGYGWRFYDTEEDQRRAFAAWLAQHEGQVM